MNDNIKWTSTANLSAAKRVERGDPVDGQHTVTSDSKIRELADDIKSHGRSKTTIRWWNLMKPENA